MSKASRDKGARREREFVNMFRDWGLKAQRVPLSGATEYAKGDIDLYLQGRDAPLVGEVKARAKPPKMVMDWLGENDFLLVKGDREKPFVVLPIRTFKELVSK